jgi:predicted secreted protein
MLNELYLGLSVVAVAMIIWLVVLFVKDPEGKIKAALTKKKK